MIVANNNYDSMIKIIMQIYSWNIIYASSK